MSLSLFSGVAEARGREVHFTIEDQPLGGALIAFAVQANVSVATPPEGFDGARGVVLRGEYTPEAALSRLLSGTGYQFTRIDAVTYRISRAQQAGAVARPSPSDLTTAGEIVVTARRRPEILDHVPASATVVSDSQLQVFGFSSADDLAVTASGLGFTNLGPGRDKIFLRGLSDGAFTGQTASTVGVYLDESRVTYGAPNPDLSLMDIERVEVLRGPQGALYGAGSIGGIVHIVTQEPDLQSFGATYSSGVETTLHGGLNNRESSMINVPLLSDRLALRAVAYRNETAGWLDNDRLGDRDTNQALTQGARVTVAARLGAGWNVTAQTLYQNIDSADSQYVDNTAGEPTRSTHILEPYGVDFTLGRISVSGPTPLGGFSSTTSLVRHSYNNRFDATGAFAGLGVDPTLNAAYDTATELKYVIEEARLDGRASPFQWSLGLFVSYGRTQSQDSLTVGVEQTPTSTGFGGQRQDELFEYALYGETVWPIGSNWELGLGARLFQSHLDARAQSSGVNAIFADDFSGARTENGIAPDIQLSYHPSTAAFYYARVSEGYRAGGFNAGSAALLQTSAVTQAQPHRQYGADHLWSAEAGAKLSYFRDAVHIRAAAFWQFWKNIQSDQLIAQRLPFTGNVGDGENRGVEIETTASPGHDLSLSALVSYSLPEVTKADSSFPVSAKAGFPGAPKLTAGATAIWRRDLGVWGQGELAVDALYVGHSDITFLDSTSTEIGGYLTSDIHASIRRDHWRASLYCINLTDNEAATFSYGNPFAFGDASLTTPLRPRTIGLELSFSY